MKLILDLYNNQSIYYDCTGCTYYICVRQEIQQSPQASLISMISYLTGPEAADKHRVYRYDGLTRCLNINIVYFLVGLYTANLALTFCVRYFQ